MSDYNGSKFLVVFSKDFVETWRGYKTLAAAKARVTSYWRGCRISVYAYDVEAKVFYKIDRETGKIVVAD